MSKNLFQRFVRYVIYFSLFIVLAIALGMAALYLHERKPWKIKDPSHPRFDVSKFDPNDYSSGNEMASAFRHLFKQGDSTKKDVDNLWCGGPDCGKKVAIKEVPDTITFERCIEPALMNTQFETLYYYSKGGTTIIFGMWDLWVAFDAADRIVNMCIRGEMVFPKTEQRKS